MMKRRAEGDLEARVEKAGRFESDQKNTIQDGGSVYYGMRVGESLVFQGVYNLTVHKGAIRLLGATIHANSETYKVSAIPTHALPMVECVQVENVDLVEEDRNDVNEPLFDYRAVVRIDPVENIQIGKIAPVYRQFFTPLENVTEQVPRSNAFQTFKSWVQAAQQIAWQDHPVVLVVGNKGSGKSSFCTFLTNYVHNAHYLELDVGQPEYCMPGTMSLHHTHYNFAPPYMHQNRPLKAHSLGNVSPKDQPTLYLDYAHDLLQHYQALQGEALIINTAGWAQGLGLDLTWKVAQMCNPTHVVCLGKDVDFPNMISVESVMSMEPKISAAELRQLHTLTYFHNGDYRHLTQFAPYQVPFTSVYLSVEHDGVELDDLQACINGTILAILEVQEVNGTTVDKDGIQWIENLGEIMSPENSQLLGYCIVQSIDAANNALRILTPEDVTGLATKKIVLVRGRLQMPLWALWDQTDGFKPYLSRSNAMGSSKVRRLARNR